MSEARKVEIKFAESGSDKVVAGVNKISAANRDAAASSKELAAAGEVNPMTDGSQLHARAQATQEAAKATDDLSDAEKRAIPITEAIAKVEREYAEGIARITAELEKYQQAGGADPVVNGKGGNGGLARLETMGRAQGVALLASQVGQIGTKLQQTGTEVDKFNPKLGEQLKEWGRITEAAGRAAMAAAQGFAVGGPAAAAVAAFTSLVVSMGEEWIVSAQKEAEANKKIADGMDELAKKRKEKSEAASDKNTKLIIDQLDAETRAIERQNDAYREGVRLFRERQRAELEVVDAQAALDLAKIDASGMTDEEKIRARSKINRRATERKAEGEIQTQDNAVQDTQDKANMANQTAENTFSQSQRVAADIEAQRKLRVAAQGELDSLNRAKAALPILQSQLESEKNRALASPGVGGAPGVDYAKSAAKVAELQKQIDDAQKTVDGSRTEVAILEQKNKAEEEEKKLKEKQVDLDKQLVEQKDSALKAQQIASETEAAAAAIRKSIREKLKLQLEKSDVVEGKDITEAQKKAADEKEKQDKKDDQERRKDEQRGERLVDSNVQGANAIDRVANNKELDLPAKVEDQLKRVSDTMRDHPSDDYWKRIIPLIDSIAKSAERNKDTDSAREFKKLEAELKRISQKIDHGNPGQ